MSRDYTFDTFTKNLRNRIVSAGFKENPNRPLYTQDVMIQAKSGNVPIYSVSGSTTNTIIPCGCGNPIPVGAIPEKDMANEEYTGELTPFNYQAELFPGMADFIDENIVQGDKDPADRLIASYWDDLGDDVFDDWGYFYLYDPTLGQYYFPLINPQNQDDGIMTTQTFNAFGRTFTITHGWAVQGIFKFDISAGDSLPFRFGAYGDMGSDGDEFTEDLSYPNSIYGGSSTLYYHHHAEIGDDEEILYSYFIPKNLSENNSQTYNAYYDGDRLSLISKEVTTGLIIYFSKGIDTKQWITNDANNIL